MAGSETGGRGDELPAGEVPEEIADEILLRLPSRSALARAAAACVDFRALVSSPRFLRRHRALHQDPGALLGVFTFSLCEYGSYGGAAFHPAEPPHPAAVAARAVAAAADFSFGFLPTADPAAGAGAKEAGWMVRDQCDGRFLVDRAPAGDILFTELAVCDPLSRRYVLLPPIPEDLKATVVSPLTVFDGRRRSEPFLAPAAADVEPAAFTVIWTARCPRRVVAFSFSSRDGRWRALPSPDCFVWRRRRSAFSCPNIHAVWNRRHYAHGRFFWVDCLTNRWLVLDTRTMELSVTAIASPVWYWEENLAVVEAPDGKVGVFAHDFYHAGGKANLHYYTIEHDGDADAPRWQLEKTVALPWPGDDGRAFCVRGTANGCLILEVSDGTPAFMSSHHTRDVELFKIDAKSFQVERVCQAQCAGGAAGEYCWPYFGFPPLLSLPTV